MNIESLLQKAELFTELVVDSGLIRDLQDYQNTINQNQNRNFILMNDVNDKITSKLNDVYNSSLLEDLKILIIDGTPFLERDFILELKELKEDSKIDAQTYFTKLQSILQSLSSSMNSNYSEINKLKEVLKKYSTRKKEKNTTNNNYPVCLKFNDKNTTEGLKNLSKSLRIWNIVLTNYQTLISNESPEQIKIQSVNDGCIELVFEYAWGVAESFAGVIETFSVYYASYLFIKNNLKKVFGDDTFHSEKLRDHNNDTAKLMFEEMENNLKEFIKKQMETAQEKDNRITSDGSDVKKIEIITKTVIDHFIKGNEVKFLMPFHDYNSEEEDLEEKLTEDITKKIRLNTNKVKREFKVLNEKDKLKLLNKYSVSDFDSLEKENN